LFSHLESFICFWRWRITPRKSATSWCVR